MSSLAIIPARGGSKRILGKNIKEFCGKPIISYSITAALESDIFDEVMVSTDSKEIAEIALSFGAKVPFMRSEKTSGDFASQRDVLMEVLSEYRSRGKEFDTMACIYATAPFITGDNLKKAFNILVSKKAGAVYPVTKYEYPPQRAYIVRNGYLKYEFPEYATTRSQDLETIYHDCGQFYLYNIEAFYNKKTTIIDRAMPLVIDNTLVQDIDTPDDWLLAELKYKYYRLGEK